MIRNQVGTKLLFAVALSFTSLAWAQPANDNFGSPTVISSLPFTASEDVSSATVSGSDPSCVGGSNNVWFAFTPSRDMGLEADTFNSSYDTTLSVYTGTLGALTQIACNNDAEGTPQSEVIFHATAGQTYYFMVSLLSSNVTPILTFSLNEAAPAPNDTPSTATLVSSLPFMATELTATATTSPDDPFCAGNASSVWFVFTAPQDMRVEANTFGSDYDTTLSAFAGQPIQSAMIACNDDADSGAQSQVVFNATAGTTYYFMVAVSAVFGASPGNLTFTVLDAGQPTPPFVYQAKLDRVGSTGPGLDATVHGTVICNKRAVVGFSGTISQQLGTITRSGFGDGSVVCVPRKRVRWSVDLANDTGEPFLPIVPSQVSLDATSCDPDNPLTCFHQPVDGTVRLFIKPTR